MSVPGAMLAGMNVDAAHPDLIDLDDGVYEWEPEPVGGGEPGYAHSEDHGVEQRYSRFAKPESRRSAAKDVAVGAGVDRDAASVIGREGQT